MALGNAFVGLADDATAAYANPAGLLWLRRPEASAELRSAKFITRYPTGGSATGSASFCTGPGWVEDTTGQECLDTFDGLRFADFDSRVNGASFVSYVHLFRRKNPGSEAEKYFERWRLALYRHELANFRAEIDRSDGAFIRGEDTGQGLLRSRLAGVQGRLDLKVENFGVSAAYALRESLWVGLGVSYYKFRLDSVTRRFQTVNSLLGMNPALPGPVDLSDANEIDRHLQHGSESDVALTLGLLWRDKDITPRWSLGAVYRQAPEFEFDYRFQWEDGALMLADLNPNRADPAEAAALSGHGTFETPDFFSVGGMYSIVPGVFRVALEYARVGYSNLEPESNVLLNVLQPTGAVCGDFNNRGEALEPPVPCGDNEERMGRYTVDDADELHLGLEYQIRTFLKVVLRAGAWWDPDHQMRYELPAEVDEITAPEDRFAPRFAPGEDALHLTGGIGLVPVGQRYQIDLAFDLSERAEIASLSTVLRW